METLLFTNLYFGDIIILANDDDTFSTLYFTRTSILEKRKLRLTEIHCHGLLSLISNNDIIIYGIAYNSKLNIIVFTMVV